MDRTELTVSINRYVFLDVDGVLCNRNSFRLGSASSAKADPACVAALNRITDTTDAMIVISSTWKLYGLGKCMRHLKEFGVSGEVKGMTPNLQIQESHREAEIKAWLQEYKDLGYQVERFVILDDGSDFPTLRDHLVRTDFEIGLTESDADKAIRILRG